MKNGIQTTLLLILFICLSGCGLIPMEIFQSSQTDASYKDDQPSDTSGEQRPKQPENSTPFVVEKKEETAVDEKKVGKENRKSEQTDSSKDQKPSAPAVKEPERNDEAKPEQGNEEEPVRPPEQPEEELPSEPETDEKLERAHRIANHVKNTDQSVHVEEGNVYKESNAHSEVLLKVKLNQSFHVTDTWVNEENYTIWCYVSGTVEQEGTEHPFSGWVSYQIIDPRYQP